MINEAARNKAALNPIEYSDNPRPSMSDGGERVRARTAREHGDTYKVVIGIFDGSEREHPQ